jgi:hypothetical protein
MPIWLSAIAPSGVGIFYAMRRCNLLNNKIPIEGESNARVARFAI